MGKMIMFWKHRDSPVVLMIFLLLCTLGIGFFIEHICPSILGYYIGSATDFIVYAFFFIIVFKIANTSLSKNMLILFAVMSVLSVIFVFITVKQNHFIYYWDYGNYWTKSVTLKEKVVQDPLLAIKDVYNSINSDEYNDFLSLMMSVPLSIVGVSFTKFVVLVHIMFLLPAEFILLVIAEKLVLKVEKTIRLAEGIVINIVVFLIPVLYYALLRGYIDAAILIPISLIFLLSLDYDLTLYQRGDYVNDFCIGSLWSIGLIFRRYTAFAAVGYVCAESIVTLMNLYKRDDKIKSCFSWIKHFSVIGGVSLGMLYFFFNGFFQNVFMTNYSAQYSAYAAPLKTELSEILGYFGIVVFIVIVGSLILTIFHFREYIQYTFLLIVNIFVSIVCFLRIQSMNEHHAYIIAVPMVLMLIIGFIEIKNYFMNHNNGFLWGIVVCLYCENFFSAYVPQAFKFDAQEYQSLVRNDISSLNAMAEYVNGLTKDDQTVYVLASGTTLNSDIMRSLNKPYNMNAIKNLVSTADIDLRDGFPVEFFDADIVITTDPIELHTAEGSQEVVRYLAQEIMDSNSLLGRCYQKEMTFSLDNDIEAYIFVQQETLSNEVISSIRDYYANYYPDYPELFEDRINEYLNSVF